MPLLLNTRYLKRTIAWLKYPVPIWSIVQESHRKTKLFVVKKRFLFLQALKNKILVRIFDKNIRIVTTKLTLSIDKDVVVQAKRYAKQSGRSLSELIESYLISVTQEHSDNTNLSSQLKSLIGVVTLPPDFDEKESLQAYYENKHR